MAAAGNSKRTRGRQKIEMKRIEDAEDRMITFSKRRSGIYKKASELIAMCGAEVVIIVFSPTGRPYSFGHPSVQAIADRFRGRNILPATDNRLQPLIEAHERMRMDRYSTFFNRLLALLDAEKERGKALDKITRATQDGNSSNGRLGWWERPLQGLSLNELKEAASSMEAIHRHLCHYLSHPVDLVALGLADAKSNHTPENNSTSAAKAGVGPMGEEVQD